MELQEFQRHIVDQRIIGDAGVFKTLCGSYVNRWDKPFLGIEDAVLTVLNGDRLLPCPECAKVIIEALQSKI